MIINSNSNKSVLGSGWYAKEYKNYINIYDHRCVFYMRLYKNSTPNAVAKARKLVAILNALHSFKVISNEISEVGEE